MHSSFITGKKGKSSPLDWNRFKRRCVTSVRFCSMWLTRKRSDVYDGWRQSTQASSDFYIVYFLLMNNNIIRSTITYRQLLRVTDQKVSFDTLNGWKNSNNFLEAEKHLGAGFSNTSLKKRETRQNKNFLNPYSSTTMVSALPKLFSDLGIDFVLTFKRWLLSMWPRQCFTRSSRIEIVRFFFFLTAFLRLQNRLCYSCTWNFFKAIVRTPDQSVMRQSFQ